MSPHRTLVTDFDGTLTRHDSFQPPGHLSLNQSVGISSDQTSLLSGCACPAATQILC